VDDDATALLAGVRPIVHTPFAGDAGRQIDVDSLRRLVRHVVDGGVDGVVPLGLASEPWAITEDERELVLGVVVDEVAGRVPIMAGVDGHTAIATERARRAAAAGAHALQVVPPQNVTIDQAFDHLELVAEQSGLPVLVQDAPQVTGIQLPVDVLIERVGRNPLLLGVKAEGIDSGPKVSALAAAGIPVVAGWGGLHYPESVARGTVGCIPGSDIAVALRAVHQRLAAGDREAGERLYRLVLPLLTFECRSLGLLILSAKRALVRLGVLGSDQMRAPAPTLDAVQAATVDRLFDALQHDRVPGWELAEETA
jgi:4-hydroxy-tetrahydrodipicolinate synthase